MQVLTDSIKRPNLRIMGIEGGEEVQAKGMCNIFNKIMTENFQNQEKPMPIEEHLAHGFPVRTELGCDRNTSCYLGFLRW
jgi:hypothetical protein